MKNFGRGATTFVGLDTHTLLWYRHVTDLCDTINFELIETAITVACLALTTSSLQRVEDTEMPGSQLYNVIKGTFRAEHF